MTESAAASLPQPQVASPFRPAYAVAALIVIAVMVGAILADNLFLLTFIHIMAGLLWTGIDLFMGFVVGPLLRRLPLEVRRAVIGGLVPRTLILMPTLSILTTTAGWFLAKRMGYLDLGYPQFFWVIAALLIVTVLAVQGLGYLLPTNLRLYFAFQRPGVDGEKISRMMSFYVRIIAIQGAMQVAIIVVMARFGSGL
jgi:hypothetical protein